MRWRRFLPGLVCVLVAMIITTTTAAHADLRSTPENATSAPMTPTAAQEALDAHAVYKRAVAQGLTSDAEIAQFRLAIALYRLKLYQASYGIFAEIASYPNHRKFAETLGWLGKLATDLPEPADVIERIGKYDEKAIETLSSSSSGEPSWQLEYLLGRYWYRNRRFEDAIHIFEKVALRSPYYAKAKLFVGLAFIQLRRPLEALRAFQSIVTAIDEAKKNTSANVNAALGLEDPDRLHALAELMIARTYYSAGSVRVSSSGETSLDHSRVADALAHWKAVDASSEYWTDAFFEEAWAHFLLGDWAQALGNLEMLRTIFSGAFYNPEADLLTSYVHVANCKYDDAVTLTARFHLRHEPIASDVTRLLATLNRAGDSKSKSNVDSEGAFYRLLKDVRNGRAAISPRIKVPLESALSDRQLLRHLQYVVVLEDEERRLMTNESLRESALGQDVRDAVRLAHDIAVRNAGDLTRRRIERMLAELVNHLRENAKLLDAAAAAAATNATPAATNAAATFGALRVKGQRAATNVTNVKGVASEDQILWPFTGEYWPDEKTFRQPIASTCPR